MDYYHGAISASTASSRLLSESPSSGRYLVRKCLDNGDFIVSYVKKEDDVQHILIPKKSDHSMFQHNPNLIGSPLKDLVEYLTSHFKLNCIHPVFKNDFVDSPPPSPENTTDADDLNLQKCNVCDKRVPNCAFHRKQQHSVTFCKVCENVFNKNEFSQHKATCDPSQTKLQCLTCGYETPLHSNLNKHKANCTVPSPTFSCDQCEETYFSSLIRLENHKVEKHNDRYKCNQCPKSYKTRKNLAEHVKNKHKPQDQGVPAEVVDVAGLQSPPRGVQPAAVRAGSRRPSPPRSTSQPPPSPHRSPPPPALFINLVSMICHTVTSFIMGEDEDDNEWEFIEPIDNTTRQIRIRRPRYSCDQCQFKATNKRNMRRHRKIHRVRREFKCQYCDFKRFHRSNVQRHERTCESRPTVQKRMSKKQFWHDITAQVPISNNMAYKLFSSINKVLDIKIFPKWMKSALRSGLNCWKSQLTHCLGMQLICINNQFFVLMCWLQCLSPAL